MPLSFVGTILPLRRPLLIYAASWAAFLTATVAVASFSPEMAFVWAISQPPGLSMPCEVNGAVRIPLERPSDLICLPALLFRRSKIDCVVPLVFAVAVVASSACMVHAVEIGEVSEGESDES